MTADASSASPFPAPPGRPVLVATALAFIAYFVVLHALIVDGTWPMTAMALVLAPWVVALVTSSWSSAGTSSMKAARRFLAIGILGLVAWLGWRFGHAIASRADLFVYVENLAFFVALSALFAKSLLPGRDALITRLARVARGGDMPPAVVRYTRTITGAWAAFFALVSAVSTVLFLFEPRAVWSAFVNLALWPLVVAGFLVEYAVRLRVLRDVRHIPMMAGVQAFRHRADLVASESERG